MAVTSSAVPFVHSTAVREIPSKFTRHSSTGVDTAAKFSKTEAHVTRPPFCCQSDRGRENSDVMEQATEAFDTEDLVAMSTADETLRNFR